MNLCAVCVKQYERNARNCGKTIHGFCITITQPAHSSLLVRNFLAKNNTVIMPQPPYSSDLAPCDFFLFPRLKRPMKGRRFATIGKIKTESLRELKDIPKSAYRKCFEDWKKRWHNPGKRFGLKFIPNQSDSFRFIPKSVSRQSELIRVNPKKVFNLV